MLGENGAALAHFNCRQLAIGIVLEAKIVQEARLFWIVLEAKIV